MELSELGITKAKEKQFNKKQIYSVEDLVEYFPRKYNDFSKLTGILPETEYSCSVMVVNDVKLYNNSTPLIMASGFEKGTGKRISVMWFRKQYLFQSIYNTINNEVFVCGKAVFKRRGRAYSRRPGLCRGGAQAFSRSASARQHAVLGTQRGGCASARLTRIFTRGSGA